MGLPFVADKEKPHNPHQFSNDESIDAGSVCKSLAASDHSISVSRCVSECCIFYCEMAIIECCNCSHISTLGTRLGGLVACYKNPFVLPSFYCFTFYVDIKHMYTLFLLNGSQLAKMKKSIPDMSLP